VTTKLIRVLPVAAVLVAVVAASASTGAVAGALITGADIKNGSVASADVMNKSLTGKDVKDRTLGAVDLSAATIAKLKGGPGPIGPIGPIGPVGPAGISGLQHVEKTIAVTSGANVNLVISCPDGKKIVGIAADWINSAAPTATKLTNQTTGTGYAKNTTDSTKTLRVTATCAVAG
jgi:hypothetical protein